MVKKSHTRIDVNDIVGMQFGGLIVISYKGKEFTKRKSGKRKGRLDSKNMYEVKCISCGNISVIRRDKVKNRKTVCKKCRLKDFPIKAKNYATYERIYDSKPNINNSNGVKHLSNAEKGKKEVKVMIDRKHFRLYRGYDEQKAINIANILNKHLEKHGKQQFEEWYKKGEWK